MKTLSTLCLIFSYLFAFGQEDSLQIPSKEAQITMAMYAAPDDKNLGAKVYGYDQNGEWTVLREGTNDLVCLSDDPFKSGVSVACYFSELEPFMARGRELKAEGMSTEEIRKTRGKEVESGELKMPEAGMLYVFSAKDEQCNRATGEIRDGNIRYVIYTPFATTESTGLPPKPFRPGMPWLMDPGTHRAHIMITPAKE